MTVEDLYLKARAKVKPEKVISYNNGNHTAVLQCGHERYFFRKNGKSPKKLLCARCIENEMNAFQQPRVPDALCSCYMPQVYTPHGGIPKCALCGKPANR